MPSSEPAWSVWSALAFSRFWPNCARASLISSLRAKSWRQTSSVSEMPFFFFLCSFVFVVFAYVNEIDAVELAHGHAFLGVEIEHGVVGGFSFHNKKEISSEK